jgi:hypothetical protein
MPLPSEKWRDGQSRANGADSKILEEEDEAESNNANDAFLEDLTTLVMDFPIPVRISSLYIQKSDLQFDKNGQPHLFCLGIATCSYWEEGSDNEMYFIFLPNDFSLNLQWDLVQPILREERGDGVVGGRSPKMMTSTM